MSDLSIESDLNMIKKKNFYVLSSFGHAGIDWISSLLDNHPEILIIPSLSFFRKIQKAKNKYKNFDKFQEKEKIKIFSELLDDQNKNKSLRLKLKGYDKKIFCKKINKFCKNFKNEKFEKKLFFSIHLYFSYLFKINLKKIKVIVCHEHAPWNCKYYKDFLDIKMISIIRDPRATISGSFRSYKRTEILSLSHRLEMTFSFLYYSIKNYNFHFKNKIFLISNEQFNKNLVFNMLKLSKWLKINFKQTLLKQTFLGKNWYGESSYISKNDLTSMPNKGYYKFENVKSRWMLFLRQTEIQFIELIFSEIFIIGKYKKKYSLNFLQKIFLIFNFLFSNKMFNFNNKKIQNFNLFFKKILLLTLKDRYTFFIKLI